MSRLPDGRIKFDQPGELPPVAMSLSTTAWNPTGAWRSREPVFQDARPPCSAGCPAGQNIADQLRLVAQGRIEDAGEVILGTNPFPSTTGRVCPHPCTAQCNRAHLEGPLDVPGVERAIGDALLARGFAPARKKKDGPRVAVVGAGPAGLTAAHFLAREGFAVTVFDREERPGGLLWSGIPPWRLPRRIVDAEIARALEGVEFKGGRALGRDLTLEALQFGHEAVLLAIGRHAARKLGFAGDDAANVIDGLDLLHRLHRNEPVPAGQRVLVIGGGNTALDCARSLARFGRQVQIAYRRGREDMPAFGEELEEAAEETIPIVERAMPREVIVKAGRAIGMKFVKNRVGPKDASGRSALEPIPGSDFVIDADLIVVAAGEELDRTGLPSQVDFSGDLTTGLDGVWACGDCAGGGTVAEAIGQGRRAAMAIAKALGRPFGEESAPTPVATWDRMRPFYFDKRNPVDRGRIAPAQRKPEVEVREGFDAAAACTEAKRCLSCGTCTGCDNCFTLCAERAVLRIAPGTYGVDTKRCKGCGVCVEECPRGAVTLREVGGDHGD